MLFQIYGDRSLDQLLGWVLVFVGLIVLNEIGRRTKKGGIFLFVILPLALTVYFIAINVMASAGNEWAMNNATVVYMNGWFHYAKLYAADIGCVGFMMLKYKWGIGKEEWFKPWPFVIVAINILIAVASNFESAIHFYSTGEHWWLSTEHVWLYGGWWNILNGIAGILNIFCMTGWWGIYSSKDHKDMLWPDMTIWFIIAYDVWNFEYTYLNLPTHAWYCGLALLLAPTFANALWNKGGWIQNRANTLALWCMFAQVFPLFQEFGRFAVIPTIYGDTFASVGDMLDPSIVDNLTPADFTNVDPTAQGVIAVLALAINVVVLAFIIKRAKEQGINPYKKEVWVGTKDFDEAMARAEIAA